MNNTLQNINQNNLQGGDNKKVSDGLFPEELTLIQVLSNVDPQSRDIMTVYL